MWELIDNHKKKLKTKIKVKSNLKPVIQDSEHREEKILLWNPWQTSLNAIALTTSVHRFSLTWDKERRLQAHSQQLARKENLCGQAVASSPKVLSSVLSSGKE